MNAPFIPSSEDGLADIDQSPAEWQYPLDLNRLLLPRPASTFLLRADRSKYGVKVGDILVVDRSIAPANSHIVISVEEGELCLSRLPAAEVWGVLTYVIRSMR